MVSTNGNKATVEDRALAESVIETPSAPNSRTPLAGGSGDGGILFHLLGAYADDIAPWGVRHKARDIQLRNFITAENIFAGALGIICSRNAGFSWVMDGPERTVNRFQMALEMSNQGKGWHDLIVKTTIDLSTQDNGAFWEVVRDGNRESSPFLGLNHLDAARCLHTGNPKFPVIYTDIKNKLHLLPWYNVIEFAEMPSAIENLSYYGLQYCALTRLLRKAQTIRNIDIYDIEKTGGRHQRQITLVKGVTTQQITDGLNQLTALADNMGYTRFMPGSILGAIDPKADIGHDTIDLVGLPEGYSSAEAFKQYINLIAMVFESDYQEFAPLPGGGLGTGAQSEILHLKSRGKGPATFMKLITHAINFKIAPQNVVFKFDEQDLEAEMGDAEVKSVRAQTRAVRIASGEITPQVARQLANDAGDLPLELIEMMGETDITTDVTITDESQLRKPSTTPSPNADPAPKLAPTAQAIKPQRGNDMNYNGSQKFLSKLKNLFGNPYTQDDLQKLFQEPFKDD